MADTPVPFAIPSQQKQATKPPYPPYLDDIDDDADMLVQNLTEAARGVALCLQSLSNKRDLSDVGNILAGLASVLKNAVDQVDAGYFRLPGDLASTLDAKLLSGLLARQIEQLKERAK